MSDVLPKDSKPQEPAEIEIKPKKPLSEAQIKARQKGLAAMREKRKEIDETKKVKKEKIKIAKKAVEEKILKDDVGLFDYETKMKSYDDKVSNLMREVGELRGLLTAREESKKVIEPKQEKQEKIVERVVERHIPVHAPTAPQKLTGYELLDRVFFNK